MRFEEPSSPVYIHLVQPSCHSLITQSERNWQTIQHFGRLDEIDAEGKIGRLIPGKRTLFIIRTFWGIAGTHLELMSLTISWVIDRLVSLAMR
jgi:hypothetical protein